MYKYAFDNTTVGDFRFTREEYEMLQGTLRLLAAKLKSWNAVALGHGAFSTPYQMEVENLDQMIQWGDEQLQSKDAPEILAQGLSVGTLRYFKIALIHAAWHQEKEVAETTKSTWPSAVGQALRGKIERLQKLANRLNVEPGPLLDELTGEYSSITQDRESENTWDTFISHASEDKDAFVRPLAEALRAQGLRVWYDEFTLTVGDSLRRSIDRGLARSRFGVIILSNNFFAKEWPQKELDGLVAQEVNGRKVILPVWHGVNATAIRKFSPLLADRVAVSSSAGLSVVVSALIAGMRS